MRLTTHNARLVLFLFFFKEKKKGGGGAQTDTVSIKAGHASSSYVSEVYSSGAAERANEGIKKGSDCEDLENMK